MDLRPQGDAADTVPFRKETIPLTAPTGAARHEITVYRFGTPGARPKTYLQAGLHADELPGMLVLRDLVGRLSEAAGRGEIIGEVIVVPVANPIGLTQHANGMLQGRYDATTGGNFNRDYPDLAAAIRGGLADTLGPDAEANVAAIRSAMGAALADIAPGTEIDHLRLTLLRLAHDADIVLDLHADNEALMHLYTGTPLWPAAYDLAAELDARAVLLCEKSGGNPFDEACSAPWWELASAFPDLPIPPACFAATVELRSNDEVEERLVESDASALMRVLMRHGVVDGAPGDPPRLLCEPTPLNAMQQLKSPVAGVVIYHARLGDTLRTGDVVATVTDPLGDAVEIAAQTDGRLFARHSQNYAWPGKVIGKIAGADPLPDRVGKLLND